MQIKYLGHAGFCVETSASLIIMDPWVSPHGAFDSAWFQYPRNHYLAHDIQEKLKGSKKNKYVYISHEHQDHFDISFLTSLKNREFTLLLANYDTPRVKQKLDEINYTCNEIILLNHEEPYPLVDGVITLFIVDTEINCDSAILVESETSRFLNLNDCKLHDKLDFIVKKYGLIDVFTAQFSGASWYPTCYETSPKEYETLCQEKINHKFESVALAIDVVKPALYLPSAGPPCFIDPELMPIHAQPINTYPRANQLLRYLDERFIKDKLTTRWCDFWPGDVLDVKTLGITHEHSEIVPEASVSSYLQVYAQDYQDFFNLRQQENKTINPQEVFLKLKSFLLKKIKALTLVNHQVTTLLYWRVSDYPDAMYCIDLAKKTIECVNAIDEAFGYYRITSSAWQINKVLQGELSWSDFALTMRLTLARVPDVYDPILHGFLILDDDKIKSFCEKSYNFTNKKERIVVECNNRRYSILKYCPHQGADLSQAQMKGCLLTCPRHQWVFNLEKAGACEDNSSTLDAIFLDIIHPKG